MNALTDLLMQKDTIGSTILHTFLYTIDFIVMTAGIAWLAGFAEALHIYMLCAGSISITITALIKHREWRRGKEKVLKDEKVKH